MNKDKRSETLQKALEFVPTLNRLVIRTRIQSRGSFMMKLKWPLSGTGKGCYSKGPITHQSIFLLIVQVFNFGSEQQTVCPLLVSFPEDSHLSTQDDVSLIAFPF